MTPDSVNQDQLLRAIRKIVDDTTATTSQKGVVKASNANGKVSVDSDGVMTANGVPSVWPCTCCITLHIPHASWRCNYTSGVGRCRGPLRRTSLQIQGSEDFCFGYQAVTKKWCSQLFRNRLIGCFYSKNAGTLDGSRIFLYLCRQSTTK